MPVCWPANRLPPVLLAMSGMRTYPQKMPVGSRSISRSRSSIRGDGVICQRRANFGSVLHLVMVSTQAGGVAA